MFSAFQTFGRLGAGARAVAAAWSPSALWPTGTEPGMWIDPSNLASQWQDSTGTTPVSTPGTVADSSNPVGLALDLRLGATALTDPGNHLLQATSTARPMQSARRNLLQYTEDFTNGYWLNATTVTPNYGTAPDGTQTSTRLVFPGPNNAILQANILSTPTPATAYCYVKGAAGETLLLENNLGTPTLITLTGAWQLASKSSGGGTSFVIGTYGGATARDVEVWHPQFELGTTATDYQAILTDGSSYPSTGFPIYQKYDGTDDGMATASFAAGTLSNAMDCLIAVRRDSGTGVHLIGLWDDVNRWFAAPDATDSSQVCYGVCGTPTVFVDGVQLTGGTAVKRDTLAAALTVGDWHIMEFRNLDLSLWASAKFGNYYAAAVNGGQGGILLFPSSTPTADRDAARTWLGAKVGLTL